MRLLLLPLAACSGPGHTVDEGPPAIVLLDPPDGATVCGSPLHVVTEVTGIDLVDPYDPPDPLPPGSGHVDLTLNGQDALMSDREVLDVPDVVDGDYQVKVELSNADHSALEPYAGDYVYVTVDAGACP